MEKKEIRSIPTESAPNKEEEAKKKLWHIDREMIYFKLHYFLFMGGLSMVLPYLPVYAKNKIGLSASSLAVLLMAEQFLFVVSKPIVGYLADYFNKLKAIICILTIGQTLFFFLLLTIPKIERSTNSFYNRSSFAIPVKSLNFSDMTFIEQLNNQASSVTEEDINYNDLPSLISVEKLAKPVNECVVYSGEVTSNKINWQSFETTLINTSHTFVSVENKVLDVQKNRSVSILYYFCRIYWNSMGDCYLIPCEAPKNHTEGHTKSMDTSDFFTSQFWLFALYSASALTCTSAMYIISDTACCESVQKSGSEFGRQRLWGGISWGIICPIGGYLNDITGDYLVSWILMAILSTLALWNLQKMGMVKPNLSQNILKDVGLVLKSKEFLSFETSVLMNGIANGFAWFYLMWFLASIGGNGLLLGVTQAVQCFLGEIPFMFFSGWMIDKLGHFNIMTASLLSYTVRFLWFSFLQNPWLVLPVEFLYGITYGVYYTTVALYAKKSAKPGTEATTQSLLFVAHEGIGSGIGCVLAGIGFDTLGGHKTFFWVSVFSGCGAVLSIILHLCIRCQKRSIGVTPETNS